MSNIFYRLPTDEDIIDLAENMRQADIDELQLVCGLSPDDAVIESIRASDRDLLRAYHADGALVCITGCAPMDNETARPWLLATDRLDDYRYRVQRETLGILELMLKKYRRLTNVVDPRNTVAVEWLKSLGFSLGEAYLVDGEHYLVPFEQWATL